MYVFVLFVCLLKYQILKMIIYLCYEQYLDMKMIFYDLLLLLVVLRILIYANNLQKWANWIFGTFSIILLYHPTASWILYRLYQKSQGPKAIATKLHCKLPLKVDLSKWVWKYLFYPQISQSKFYIYDLFHIRIEWNCTDFSANIKGEQ